ncbi:MAG TPA: ribosomal protein S18-alanine N-acetyltransferase [Syntrophales bacterium]|nr:ribosomal protein S18-alanine N-acetyltransferase [Syntrophales bacterium]
MNQQSIEIERMEMDDIDEILSIENSLFPAPWSRAVFERELELPISRSLVAKIRNDSSNEIAGYIIYWIIEREVHVHKIAVRKDLQKSGIASKLMAEMIRLSYGEGAVLCILEVGLSNESAKKLYEKFGFTVREVRSKYYAESGDDALVMLADLKK